MAEEETDEPKEPTPKPVRKVKKTLLEEPPSGPAAEQAASKPAAESATEGKPSAGAKPAAKPSAKKVAAKPAETKLKAKVPGPKAPAPEEEPEKKPKAAPKGKEKPSPKGKEKPAEKKKPGKKGEKKEEEEEAEEEEHEARKKPELTDAIRLSLRLRREIARRRPTFYRQEWFRHPRLGLKWRKPQGGQSKLRRHMGWRINVVSIGFRGPKTARGLHPSGFREVVVHTAAELKGVDSKVCAVRIAGGVGGRKREHILEAAEELGLRVLNRREE